MTAQSFSLPLTTNSHKDAGGQTCSCDAIVENFTENSSLSSACDTFSSSLLWWGQWANCWKQPKLFSWLPGKGLLSSKGGTEAMGVLFSAVCKLTLISILKAQKYFQQSKAHGNPYNLPSNIPISQMAKLKHTQVTVLPRPLSRWVVGWDLSPGLWGQSLSS